ncbi:FtsX-like permease family protein [Spongisporangium articulatum]|uniref:FtsX-like permease family protein n=1 Tax=Spongisporangium articulatum TaxID=3362603 RepID=A0ABW8AMV8_9ACTN
MNGWSRGVAPAAVTSDAERRRARLLAAAVAVTGALLIATEQILTLIWTAASYPGPVEYVAPDGTLTVVSSLDDNFHYQARHVSGLSEYLSQPGLLGGATLVPALLAVTVLVFAVQALRIGTVARERRLAAFSLAGATRRQLRRLAAREGTRAAVRGALLAGPAYLVLWLLLGVLAPDGWKLLPPLDWTAAVTWVLVVPLLGLLGGLVSARTARTAEVSPLGITRRAPRALTWRTVAVPVVSLTVCLAFLVYAFRTYAQQWVILLGIVAAVVFCLSLGPLAVVGLGRLAVRSDRLETALAGRRLLADPRPSGRVAGVLFAVGLTLGFEAYLAVGVLREPGYTADDLAFYLGGVAIVGVAAVLSALVACLSMVVAASEQVLEGRRGVAVLVSLAASPGFALSVVRRQLRIVAVPLALTGAVIGLVALGLGDPVSTLAGLPALLVVYLLGRGGAALAARAVAPVVRECSGPENLRAA